MGNNDIEQARDCLMDVLQQLMFIVLCEWLPEFSLMLNQLRAVLTVDIDTGRSIQNKVIAGVASVSVALAVMCSEYTGVEYKIIHWVDSAITNASTQYIQM